MSGAGERSRQARRAARPGNEAGRQWPSLSDRIHRCLIAAARCRQAAAGSRSVPKTTISPASTPLRRSARNAAEPGRGPEPTIAIISPARQQPLDEVPLEREEDGERE